MKTKKTHDMLSLMLDPRFKKFRLVSSWIDLDQVVFMVEVYDRQSLFSMLLKCHHVLHPMLEFEIVLVH
jgi:hypothetical protein